MHVQMHGNSVPACPVCARYVKLSLLASVKVIVSWVGSCVICVIRPQISVFRHPVHNVTGMSSPGPKDPKGAFSWFFTTT